MDLSSIAPSVEACKAQDQGLANDKEGYGVVVGVARVAQPGQSGPGGGDAQRWRAHPALRKSVASKAVCCISSAE